MSSTRSSITVPPYGCKVVIILTDDLIGQVNNVYRKHKMKLKYEDNAEGVVICPDIDVYYLIINKKFLTHNTIAHEVFHIAIRITQARGIKEEEARAWVAGYVSEGVYKFLDKKNFQIKHGQ